MNLTIDVTIDRFAPANINWFHISKTYPSKWKVCKQNVYVHILIDRECITIYMNVG